MNWGVLEFLREKTLTVKKEKFNQQNLNQMAQHCAELVVHRRYVVSRESLIHFQNVFECLERPSYSSLLQGQQAFLLLHHHSYRPWCESTPQMEFAGRK
jgi:hypothetical protein